MRGLNEFTHAKPEHGPRATKHWVSTCWGLGGRDPGPAGPPPSPLEPWSACFLGPLTAAGQQRLRPRRRVGREEAPPALRNKPLLGGSQPSLQQAFQAGASQLQSLSCPRSHLESDTQQPSPLPRPPLPSRAVMSSPSPSRRVHTSTPQGHLRACPLAIHPRLTNHQLESFICGNQRPTWGTSIFPGHWSDRCLLEQQLRATARALGAGRGGLCVGACPGAPGTFSVTQHPPVMSTPAGPGSDQ